MKDSEILTKQGWKKWYEIKKGAMVASYNINKNCIEFVQASWIHKERV